MIASKISSVPSNRQRALAPWALSKLVVSYFSTTSTSWGIISVSVTGWSNREQWVDYNWLPMIGRDSDFHPGVFIWLLKVVRTLYFDWLD